MIQVANAPCSWGVIENIEGERILYPQVLNEIESTGYAGTELGDWGFMPTDPAELRGELAGRQLSLLASWVSVHLHDPARVEESIADAVRVSRLLAEVGGPDNLIVLGNDPYGDPMRTKHAGRVRPEQALDEAGWQRFAEAAQLLAQRVRDASGLRTVFHHHVGTWIETPDETRRLMAMTDPSLLGLCFDTGHWSFGGGDPVAAISEFGERIWHVHFKDHDPAVARRSREEAWDGPTSIGQGIFCELGQGDVDFPGVLAALRQIGYQGWIVVEQDVLPGMGTPRESAGRNRDYLRSIGI